MQQDDITVEEWRPVDGWPGCEVSDLGRVRRWGKMKRTGPNWSGYPMATCTVNGKMDAQRVHRLVCAAFNGPPTPGQTQVRHLDGSKDNNVPSNLRWGTAAENQADRALHGTSNRGARHGLAKLTAAQVAEIRRRHGEGETQRAIGAAFGVHQMTVSRVVRRKNWKHT